MTIPRNPTTPARQPSRLTSNATPRPDLARRDRKIDAALIDAILRGITPLEELAAIARARRLEARDPEPDVMLVRHLGLEHLGRWIYLPGRPALAGPDGTAEPTVVSAGGLLVGLRPGTLGRGAQPSTRILVITQGSATLDRPARVDDRVDVAPREWTTA